VFPSPPLLLLPKLLESLLLLFLSYRPGRLGVVDGGGVEESVRASNLLVVAVIVARNDGE
jgi:hypothetical protein